MIRRALKSISLPLCNSTKETPPGAFPILPGRVMIADHGDDRLVIFANRFLHDRVIFYPQEHFHRIPAGAFDFGVAVGFVQASIISRMGPVINNLFGKTAVIFSTSRSIISFLIYSSFLICSRSICNLHCEHAVSDGIEDDILPVLMIEMIGHAFASDLHIGSLVNFRDNHVRAAHRPVPNPSRRP
jgi:hypothetical protein